MIVLENICKKYGDVTVFENFNIAFKKNEISCVMGRSGAGKTTLFRILMGLEAQDSGSVSGMENERLSAVFQENRLCENLDVYTNIMLPHLYKSKMTAALKTKLDSALNHVGLGGLGGKEVRELSGGMKRRVAIIRALFTQCNILLLDEPFKGLDDEIKEKTVSFLQSTAKGKTIIYITHDKTDLELIRPYEIFTL